MLLEQPASRDTDKSISPLVSALRESLGAFIAESTGLIFKRTICEQGRVSLDAACGSTVIHQRLGMPLKPYDAHGEGKYKMQRILATISAHTGQHRF